MISLCCPCHHPGPFLCVFSLITSCAQQQDQAKAGNSSLGLAWTQTLAESLPDLHRGIQGIKSLWNPALAGLGMGGADLKCPKSVPCSHQTTPWCLFVCPNPSLFGAQIPLLWFGSAGVLSFGAEQKPSRAGANCCCFAFPKQLELNPAGMWRNGQHGKAIFPRENKWFSLGEAAELCISAAPSPSPEPC